MRGNRVGVLVGLVAASCASVVGLDGYTIADSDGDADARASNLEAGDGTGPSCTASLAGTITDPRGVNVVPNAIVYLPATTPSAFPVDGPRACETCASSMTGSPMSTAVTGNDGTFTLSGVPVGRPFSIVFMTGRWRRQVMVDPIPSCGAVATLPTDRSSLPKNQLEGDLPKIAVTLTNGDPEECFLRKVGIDDRELTSNTGPGRVHLYLQNGATIDGGTSGPTDLWDNPARLATYDIVMAPCDNHAGSTKRGPTPEPPARTPSDGQLANMKAYVEAGGRLFTTHWAAIDFVYGIWPPPAGPVTAAFGENLDNDRGPPAIPYTVDTSTPLGQRLAAVVGGPSVASEGWRHMVVSVATDAGATRLFYGDSTQPPVSHPQNAMTYGGPHVGAYVFDAPWPTAHCGRVAAITGHAATRGPDAGAGDAIAACGAADLPMTPEEKAYELLLFHTGACLGPPVE